MIVATRFTCSQDKLTWCPSIQAVKSWTQPQTVHPTTFQEQWLHFKTDITTVARHFHINCYMKWCRLANKRQKTGGFADKKVNNAW